jgi:alpha-beta hydrolase superfamily lysophospholipase
MSHQQDSPGGWGRMQETPEIKIATEELATTDACKLFLRSWQTDSSAILLILHGLGGHSGWYIDMGNKLASRGITVYAMDHRGFGRSGGLPGHIDDYSTYVEDTYFIVTEIRKRHPEATIYMLGHSMGGIFTAHFAAKYGNMLAGVLFLNPWIQDVVHVPLLTQLAIAPGGLFKSRRYWQAAPGTEAMTSNPEAIRMLLADPYWRRKQTASFLFQILLMRLAVVKKAKHIAIPALVMQAEADKTVVPAATHKFYETLVSGDKMWKTYPGYSHDSEFEHDRSQLDNDLVTWIYEHSVHQPVIWKPAQ